MKLTALPNDHNEDKKKIYYESARQSNIHFTNTGYTYK